MSKIIYSIYNHTNFSWQLYILSGYIRRDFFRTCKQYLSPDHPKNTYKGLILQDGVSNIIIPIADSDTNSKALYLAKKYQTLLFEEINESLYNEYFTQLERKFELVVEQAPYFLEWFEKFQSRYADTIDPQIILSEMSDYSIENFHTFVQDNFCSAQTEYIVD